MTLTWHVLFINDIIQVVIVFTELQYHMANLLEALRSRVANASEFHVHWSSDRRSSIITQTRNPKKEDSTMPSKQTINSQPIVQWGWETKSNDSTTYISRLNPGSPTNIHGLPSYVKYISCNQDSFLEAYSIPSKWLANVQASSVSRSHEGSFGVGSESRSHEGSFGEGSESRNHEGSFGGSESRSHEGSWASEGAISESRDHTGPTVYGVSRDQTEPIGLTLGPLEASSTEKSDSRINDSLCGRTNEEGPW